MPHPVKTADYGSYLWLMREVGYALDVGREDGNWNFETEGRIDSIVQSGYYQFCYPPPLEQFAHRGGADAVSADTSGVNTGSDQAEQHKERQNRSPHVWSFLRGMETLSLVPGKTEYDAPSDFTGVMSDLIVTTGEGRLPVVSDDHLRSLLAKDTENGTPRYVAVRPKSADGQGHQGWKIILYPAPDKAMSATFRYTVTPGNFGHDNPFPLGGRQHTETLLASCLAVAEERDGALRGAPLGTAANKFMQRLAASIHIDRQASRPSGDGTSWSEETTDADKIRGQIGFFMGFGQNKNGWSEAQKQQVMECQRQGLRRFYMPTPLPGQRIGHTWSFLFPIANINLQANVYVYDLPLDFGGMDAPMTYAPGTNVIYPPVEIIGEQQIRRLLQSTTQADGRPVKGAIRQKKDPQTGGTRYEIIFWPVPDAAYELHYRYRVSPDDNLEVIHGGQAHMQTIIESCLGVAESMLRRRERRHEQLFMERLLASISYDQQLASPKSLGYNRDNSDGHYLDASDDLHRLGYAERGVTYNGIQY